MKIAIIDYAGGNVASVAQALERLGYSAVVTNDAETIRAADKVIFPGQGRAAPAMRSLASSGLVDVIRSLKQPFLGICLGMQLLYEHTEEDDTECLGILKGKVTRFSEQGQKVPQIGWNTIVARTVDPLWVGMPGVVHAYFANSYYVPQDAEGVIAATAYGTTQIASVIRRDNFYGMQFHPEKSGAHGLALLKNFCALGTNAVPSAILLPAIDLIDGKCVRLRQGDYDAQTTYANDPVAMARSFEADGATYLHIVDLDGAKAGEPKNVSVIRAIASAVKIPIQVGGGIRSEQQVKAYLDAGVARIILSTASIEDESLVKALIKRYGPDRVVISIDAKDGFVATKGWKTVTAITVSALLERMQRLGVTTVIYTDIASDGMLAGPNYERVTKVLHAPFRVIIAGGVSSIDDVLELSRRGAYGVISGKALYEKKIDLKQAVAQLATRLEPLSTARPISGVTKRVIACMDIAGGRVVKGVHFADIKDAGDPVELARRYSDAGADELVFLDINATVEDRSTLTALVTRIAREINVPFTVGGGVRSLEDIRALLSAGADKVSIGSAAITHPELVRSAALEFGSQCIVISVDPKKNDAGVWELYSKGGRVATGVDALSFCKQMQEMGAGELLVNSLDRDGTGTGFDIELLHAISSAVRIPVIASSGAGTFEHFKDAIVRGGADAVLAASLFHTGAMTIGEVKQYLQENDILIRI